MKAKWGKKEAFKPIGYHTPELAKYYDDPAMIAVAVARESGFNSTCMRNSVTIIPMERDEAIDYEDCMEAGEAFDPHDGCGFDAIHLTAADARALAKFLNDAADMADALGGSSFEE
jgi:hypothetical protein